MATKRQPARKSTTPPPMPAKGKQSPRRAVVPMTPQRQARLNQAITRAIRRTAPNSLATWLNDLGDTLASVEHFTRNDFELPPGRVANVLTMVRTIDDRTTIINKMASVYPERVRLQALHLTGQIQNVTAGIASNRTADEAMAHLQATTYTDLILSRLATLSRKVGPDILKLANIVCGIDDAHGVPEPPAPLDEIMTTTIGKLAAKIREGRPRQWSRWLPLSTAGNLLGCDWRTLRDNANIKHQRQSPDARRWRFDLAQVAIIYGQTLADKLK